MTAIRYALAASIALMGWGIDTIRAVERAHGIGQPAGDDKQ